MGSYLAPLQLGYSTALGAEAAVHSSRLYLSNLPPDHVLLKLDFKNAFNSVRRDKMLEAAKEHEGGLPDRRVEGAKDRPVGHPQQTIK